jgi:hypothetical protein
MHMQAQRADGDIVPKHSQPRSQKRAGGQHHASAVLPPGKAGYAMYKRHGGPRGRSGQA